MLSLKDFFLKLIQGIVIGIGAVLPGISGGVLSVVFGVYQPIMEFLADPVSCLKPHLPVLFPAFLAWPIYWPFFWRNILLFPSASSSD